MKFGVDGLFTYWSLRRVNGWGLGGVGLDVRVGDNVWPGLRNVADGGGVSPDVDWLGVADGLVGLGLDWNGLGLLNNLSLGLGGDVWFSNQYF